MATGVRITTKPNGNHERAQREQGSHPHSPSLPCEVQTNGKTLLPREVSSQLCPVEEKRSCCTNILCGERQHEKQEKGQGSTDTRILEVHLDSKPVHALLREEANKSQGRSGAKAEWEPGHAFASIFAPATAASPLGYTHQGQHRHGPMRHGNEKKFPPTARLLSTCWPYRWRYNMIYTCTAWRRHRNHSWCYSFHSKKHLLGISHFKGYAIDNMRK